MRLIFHGTLRDLYGKFFDIEARTVADAIEGFSIQAPNWPRKLRISAVGHDTAESLYESPEEVHLMPSITGGGGNFGKILLGAAIIGLGFVTGGITWTAAAGLGTTVLGGLALSMGAAMILQGIMGVFMKTPKIRSVNDPEASKYLSVNQNTTASGTPITLAGGRIDLAGHWLSLQSDSSNLSYGSFPTNPT